MMWHSARDISSYINYRDVLSNASSSGRDILSHAPSHSRDILSQVPSSHSRDILSHVPSSHSRDILSQTPTSSRDILSFGPNGSRDILSYVPTSSRDILSTYTPREYSSGTVVARGDLSSYGSGVGSRDILSYIQSHDIPTSVTNGGRDILSVTPGREKATAASSRSTSRLPTHRSMTKLNSNVASSSGLDNKIGKLMFWNLKLQRL